MPLDSLNRRTALALTGSAVLAALGGGARAGEALIGKLIDDTRNVHPLSRRIEVISAALIGKRYRAETLIGGPKKAEVFVVRDDGFDCVTYCETVLAAARATDIPVFEGQLRKIRYHNGTVEWRERNHDFAAWCVRNVENGVLAPVLLGQPAMLKKIMTYPSALGRRTYEIAAVPRATLFAQKAALRSGDVIGFVSRRAELDYFHCGFLIVGAKGELTLRDAALSRGRVGDAPLANFFATNGTQHVTVLRPVDPGERKT